MEVEGHWGWLPPWPRLISWGLTVPHVVQFPAADVSTLSEAVPSESRPAGIQSSLLSPLLPEAESPFDLEQQWQDLMSIMEMQVRAPWGGSCWCWRGGSGKGFALLGARCHSAEVRGGAVAAPSTRLPDNGGWRSGTAALVLPQPVQ